MHIKIGTRNSKLALWQAKDVEKKLKKNGNTVEIIEIISEGDKILDTPLPLIGGKGIFTKALDDALIEKKIDIAVHSYKDIPVENHNLLQISSVLKRENPIDVLLFKKKINLSKEKATIGTSSNRRKAQWLNKYPHHTIVDIRGNVPTRISKLKQSNLDGIILAYAGVSRLDLLNEIGEELHWMIPAPAQGAIAIMSLKENIHLNNEINKLSNKESWLCADAERSFLNHLDGGCSSPIGAYSYIENNKVFLKGVVLDKNGSKKIEVKLSQNINETIDIGKKAAELAIKKGVLSIIN